MSDPFTGGFGQFVPGFEFLRNLSGNAGGTGSASLPNLGSWVAPTLNVEELDKRIEELKAVQFWLDQNAKALAATIQALQVQKMTLSTLQSMNLNLGDVTQAAAQAWSTMGGASPAVATPARAKSTFAGLEVPPRAPASVAPAPVPTRPAAKKTTRRAAPGATPEGSAGVVDPMQWWGALTQQFQQIAGQAMQEAAHAASAANAAPMPAAATQKARKRAASPQAAGARRPAARRS